MVAFHSFNIVLGTLRPLRNFRNLSPLNGLAFTRETGIGGTIVLNDRYLGRLLGGVFAAEP